MDSLDFPDNLNGHMAPIASEHKDALLGPLGGARLHSRESIGRMVDRVLDRLLRLVDSMSDERLDRGMHYLGGGIRHRSAIT